MSEVSEMIFPGDIILVKGTAWYSHLIRFWTYSKYSHVHYVVLNGVIDITFPRVKKISLDDIKEEVLVLRWSPVLCADELAQWCFFFESLVGKKYDLAGLLSFVIHAKVQNKSFYFCSEAGYDAAKKINRRIWLRKDPEWITPQDYEESLAFFVVYEGYLPKK
jgi:hypothetical protein